MDEKWEPKDVNGLDQTQISRVNAEAMDLSATAHFTTFKTSSDDQKTYDLPLRQRARARATDHKS